MASYEPVYCANPLCQSARVRDRPRHIFDLERPLKHGGRGKCEECKLTTVASVAPAGALQTRAERKAG